MRAKAKPKIHAYGIAEGWTLCNRRVARTIRAGEEIKLAEKVQDVTCRHCLVILTEESE